MRLLKSNKSKYRPIQWHNILLRNAIHEFTLSAVRRRQPGTLLIAEMNYVISVFSFSQIVPKRFVVKLSRIYKSVQITSFALPNKRDRRSVSVSI